MKWTFIICIFVLIVAEVSTVVSGELTARDLYLEGTRLFDDGQYEEAAQAFRKAYALKPSWKLRYNIGQSEAAAKKYGLALEQFEAYLVEAGDELTAEREEMVGDEIRRLKTKVGDMTIVAPEGARILVDDEQRGVAPLPGKLRVNAGVLHHLKIELENETLLARDVRLGSQESIQIRVEQGDETSTVSDAGDADVTAGDEKVADDVVAQGTVGADDRGLSTPVRGIEQNRWIAAAGWSLVGLGSAAMITGGILGGMVISRNNQLKDLCDMDTHVCDEQQKETRDSALKLGRASTVLLPAGAVLASVGVVLLVVSRRKRESMVTVAPVLAQGVAGIFMEGRF